MPDPHALRLRDPHDDADLVALFNEDRFQRFATHLPPFAGVEEMRGWLACLGADKCEIVCECEGQLAGFAGLYLLTERQSHIGWFFLGVREKFQRRGFGAALLQRLLEIADLLAGLQRVQLTVFADNEPAIRLYRRFGFEIEGLHPDFIRREDGPVDAYTMARLTTADAARQRPQPDWLARKRA